MQPSGIPLRYFINDSKSLAHRLHSGNWIDTSCACYELLCKKRKDKTLSIARTRLAHTHTHMSRFCFDHTAQIFRVENVLRNFNCVAFGAICIRLIVLAKCGARKIRTRIVAPSDNLWADIDFKPHETRFSLAIELETKLKITLFRMNNCKGFVAEPEMIKHVCGLFFSHFTCVVQMCNSILIWGRVPSQQQYDKSIRAIIRTIVRTS